MPSEPLRQSVPTAELQSYFECGWAYIMPDFDKPNHSKIEWLSDKLPVYPANRVPIHDAIRKLRNENVS